MAPSLTNTFLLITFLVVLLPVKTYAFGAGDIPDFAYLNGAQSESPSNIVDEFSFSNRSPHIHIQTKPSVMETLKIFWKLWPNPLEEPLLTQVFLGSLLLL